MESVVYLRSWECEKRVLMAWRQNGCYIGGWWKGFRIIFATWPQKQMPVFSWICFLTTWPQIRQHLKPKTEDILLLVQWKETKVLKNILLSMTSSHVMRFCVICTAFLRQIVDRGPNQLESRHIRCVPEWQPCSRWIKYQKYKPPLSTVTILPVWYRWHQASPSFLLWAITARTSWSLNMWQNGDETSN